MKIRNGFISNSSSSSFVIIYKKDIAMLYDFARFEMFKGYSIFSKDFCEAEEFDKNVLNTIISLIYSYIYEVANTFSANTFNSINYNQLYDLFELANMNIFDKGSYLDKIFNKINDFKKDFWDNIKNIDKDFYIYMQNISYIDNIDLDSAISLNMAISNSLKKAWYNFKNEYNKNLRKYIYSKNCVNNITAEAEKCINAIKEKNYSIKYLQYGDDTKDGAMMENYFMPFLANDPEQKFIILINRNH